MKQLIELGNEYIERSDWTDFALIKLCLCAMGIMIGCAIPERRRKPFVAGALVVFFATYIPLILRLFGILLEQEEE